MNCKKVKKILSSYIDREVDEKTAINIKEHLLECSGCKKQYEILLRTKKLLNSLPEVDLPPDFIEKVYQESDKRLQSISTNSLSFILNWFLLRKKKAFAFCLIVILFFGIYLIRSLQISQKQNIKSRNLLSAHLASVKKGAFCLNNKSIAFVSNEFSLNEE